MKSTDGLPPPANVSQGDMRLVLVNASDIRGGAARAAYRLHRGLLSMAIDSKLLVQTKEGDDPSVMGPDSRRGRALSRLRPALDLLPILAYPNRKQALFHPGWLPDGAVDRIRFIAPDLVHLHWIAGGFVNVRALRSIRRPLVWTLHDMWAFTGGCHYDDGCERYAVACGRCPILGSRSHVDLSYLGLRRRARAYRRLPLNVVTPSRWLADSARRSALLSGLPISVIPNGLDTIRFRPLGRRASRDLLGLPADHILILFGTAHGVGETRKGFDHLLTALHILTRRNPSSRFTALIFGSSTPSNPPDLGMPSIYMGSLNDDVTLAALYSAADVFVAPSTQENLSNTVMEALSCGTPCVAFALGGMPDMIEHERNGFLAKPLDPVDLAKGVSWIVEDESRRQALAERARQKVLEEFEITKVAGQYVELYHQILASRPPK